MNLDYCQTTAKTSRIEQKVNFKNLMVIEFANMTCAASLFGDKGTSNIFCLTFIFGLSIVFATVMLDFNISLISQKQYVMSLKVFT